MKIGVNEKRKVAYLVLLLISRIILRRKKARRFWIRPTLMEKRAHVLLQNARFEKV
jgi:hypothetical protein